MRSPWGHREVAGWQDDDREAAASSLVEEHATHRRHISELRRREKQITDERLESRLARAGRGRAGQ